LIADEAERLRWPVKDRCRNWRKDTVEAFSAVLRGAKFDQELKPRVIYGR